MGYATLPLSKLPDRDRLTDGIHTASTNHHLHLPDHTTYGAVRRQPLPRDMAHILNVSARGGDWKVCNGPAECQVPGGGGGDGGRCCVMANEVEKTLHSGTQSSLVGEARHVWVGRRPACGIGPIRRVCREFRDVRHAIGRHGVRRAQSDLRRSHRDRLSAVHQREDPLAADRATRAELGVLDHTPAVWLHPRTRCTPAPSSRRAGRARGLREGRPCRPTGTRSV